MDYKKANFLRSLLEKPLKLFQIFCKSVNLSKLKNQGTLA